MHHRMAMIYEEQRFVARSDSWSGNHTCQKKLDFYLNSNGLQKISELVLFFWDLQALTRSLPSELVLHVDISYPCPYSLFSSGQRVRFVNKSSFGAFDQSIFVNLSIPLFNLFLQKFINLLIIFRRSFKFYSILINF